ncbi:insulinase family protein [Aerococcaceae bacterium NML190938]|nr:insulinase family protein [Aerococcaceae bacterium NML190938]MCW6680944.1 insulinase family protein [Aerococcaceae bacterium NML130460]
MTFKLLEARELPDIQSLGKLYEHVETGAQVLHLINDDTNKAFTIAFRTPPYNDNGIAHILEHSVLNGSQKFPSKEPFVELLKGSLNTFVNAMTYPDKTLYPVASTNQKDFTNLMTVYLDAVFQPKIYDNPQILQQEGWHYHLENLEDDLIYKGVVYNEMKGANASPERQLMKSIAHHLYPNTTYSFDSGGLSSAIPSLTQKEFLAFHQRYYHPTNSLTILYGDLDADIAFNLLEEYFAKADKKGEAVDLTLALTDGVTGSYQETYSLAAGDSPTDKDYLTLAWHVAEADDILDYYGLKILLDILMGNNQAPLKKALIEAEIGGDITSSLDELGFPYALSIIAKYSSADKMSRFKEVVEDTLRHLVQTGLNQERIAASLNKYTFKLRESVISESNPRGVLYGINVLQTWLYGKSPFTPLEFNAPLSQLAELAKEGYFEQLIERKLLNNPRHVDITLVAEPGKNDAIEAELHAALQAYKASLSPEQLSEIVDTTQALIMRQETPDNPADLAKIPSLTREDLTTEVEHYPLKKESLFADTTFYHAEQFTSGIDYVGLYFDVQDFAEEDYLWLNYLSLLFTKLPTSAYDIADLQTQIDLHTGGIHGKVSLYEDQQGKITPYFVLHGKALENSFERLLELMHCILSGTQFDSSVDLLAVVQRAIANFEQAINYSAHALAINRALSQLSPFYKMNELVAGIDQFNHLKKIRDFLKEDGVREVVERLEQLMKKLWNKRRLNALYIGGAERATQVKHVLEQIFATMPDEPLAEPVEISAGTRAREAFVTAQDVNYVALATDARGSLTYSGVNQVLSSIVRLDYLWNNIRVKGGAYGSFFAHKRNGEVLLGSYRDPNIRETLAVYERLPEYISDINLSTSEETKYMIGVMSDLEQPISAADKGFKAFAMLHTGTTTQEIEQLKRDVLATTSRDLALLSQAYQQALNDATTVVIGNKAKIDAEADLFDIVYDLY